MTAKLIGAEALRARLLSISRSETKRNLMQAFGAEVVARAKRSVPRKTSNLGRTISVTEVSSTRLVVTAGAAYAAHVEYGTRPHDIRPKNKQALFFPSQQVTTARFGSRAKLKFRKTGSLTTASMRRFGNAGFAHAKVVHHPGTRAQPFLRPAAESTLADAGDIVLGDVVARWNASA